ncbi:MAG: aminopeptidase [Flavobacterium sp. BFFFF2]|nr:MAG: aminopeptidase [Flavobacterium sp. BFFFF2]
MFGRIENLLLWAVLFGLPFFSVQAQHATQVRLQLQPKTHDLEVWQDIQWVNTGQSAQNDLILYDWNHAFSSESSPLAWRFSDEFLRHFFFGPANEKGNTKLFELTDQAGQALTYERFPDQIDLIKVHLPRPVAPQEKVYFRLHYKLHLPEDSFTSYGVGSNEVYQLREFLIMPTRFVNNQFLTYSHLSLEDQCVDPFDVSLQVELPTGWQAAADMPVKSAPSTSNTSQFEGHIRTPLTLVMAPKLVWEQYVINDCSITSGIQETRLQTPEKAIIWERIVQFTHEKSGLPPAKNWLITQAAYNNNPFYGLNQVPAFMSPFDVGFLYEMKCLKTFLSEYLPETLGLDMRESAWIADGIQYSWMMEYVQRYHPDAKMMGRVGHWKLLKRFHLFSLDFNEQYRYFYMLSLRRNTDQSLNAPKPDLIKYNEKIASRYKAGLCQVYLQHWIGNEAVQLAEQQLFEVGKLKNIQRIDWENALKSQAKDHDLTPYFSTLIDQRTVIDYQFSKVKIQGDSLSFQLLSKNNIDLAIPVYGLKKGKTIFTHWIEHPVPNKLYTFATQGADQLALNHEQLMPEMNARNNYAAAQKGKWFNKSFKLNLVKDLEEPQYYQWLYVPTLEYNAYDGGLVGFRLHNRTMLEKPFSVDLNPSYATSAKSITGVGSLSWNWFPRNGSLYESRLVAPISFYHYAPQAGYMRINPSWFLKFRPEGMRSNRKQSLMVREVIIQKDPTTYIVEENAENYAVFNVRWIDNLFEIKRYHNYMSDLQLSDKFGKVSGEIGFRKLLSHNRQLNVRLFAGAFLYRNTQSSYFDFGVDRPTDYLFDYNYYGRSDKSGLWSQQLVHAEGDFKSKLRTRYADQWITTANVSTNIWNWFEVYGDAGVLKNQHEDAQFIYDSGLKLNLVPDYFEMYFPVHSNNGFEISQYQYSQKIRFVFTISTNTLFNLFTRKWF